MASTSLLGAVQAALGAATTLGYTASTAAHDVYEGYILSLLLEAAGNEHWTWALRDNSANPTNHAVFRLAPGRLPAGNFTHVLLSKPGKQPLEAHIGIKVVGTALRGVSRKTKSGRLLHEFDLLVLPSTIAGACRVADTDPAHAATVIHAEAKYYGGDLSLPVGRAVVGLAVECGLKDKSVLVTNQNGMTVQDLVEHYGVAFRFLIKPSNLIGEYHLVQRFQALLRAAP